MQTPRYEYSRSAISARIDELTNLELPYGLTVRYAMKANPFPEILQMMSTGGVHFDASSSYEASQLLQLGVPGSHISLSSQQSPHNLPVLLAAGVHFTATSLRQLELFLSTSDRPSTVGVRINPDLGSGANNRTNTGGVNASFGIWHEYSSDILKLTADAGVVVNHLHIHIGSGADTSIWGEVMDRSLDMVRLFPDVTTLDIGGGYKVARYGDEQEADMTAIAVVFSEKLVAFAAETDRELKLEIVTPETGTPGSIATGCL